MGLNTYPYSPFPASTEQLHKGDNEQIQAEIDQLKSGLTTLDDEVNGDATTYDYADVITIEDAVPSNLADCIVKIVPVQSGSGDPSPTNVRPITGHTEASVEVTDGDETTKTYTIALGDTIYGGTVDFDSGVMTVTHGIVTLDGTNNAVSNGSISSYNPDLYQTEWLVYRSVGVEYAVFVADKFETVTPSQRKPYSVYPSDSAPRLFVGFPVATLSTTEDCNTWLASNNLTVVYPLATPFMVQLTPQQIQLLKGQNTLTASTGDISVTVNGVSGSIGAVQEQVNATDAALEELAADIAEKLPTAPTTDGAYVLTVTVESGTPTYNWKSAE